MKKFPLIVLAVLSSLILLNSCTLDNNNTTQPQSGAFLIAQTSPTAPHLSIYINNSVFDTGLVFGNYTPYVAGVNPGTYNLGVFAPNTTTPSLTSSITIDVNKFYSYFIIDSFNKVKAAFINDVFKAPSGDSAYIRFFNFCPNSDALSLALSGGANLSADRIFNDQQTNPQYIAFNNEVKAGTYSFDLKNASDSVLKTQSINLVGGKVYTLFAKGIIGSTDSTKALSIGQLENYPQH